MASETELKKYWEKQQLIKVKVPDLKAYLKSVGLPMAGEHSNIAKRVGMWMDVKFLDLFVTQENGEKKTPFTLKQPELRKIVAQLGMDPTGDKDELYDLLIEHLKKKKDGKGTGASSSASSSASSTESIGLTTAKQILEMQDDLEAVLSVSGINITTASSVGNMRKAYLKLSLLIHPDKLQSEFPEATKAFQCLVNAYERLSQPELFLEEEKETKKTKEKKIMRSNDGCHRTGIFCPRCRGEWGLPDSGVEPFEYNFMMMGLKTYNCAGCLFEFGCMTALHKCPLCRKPFEYHPTDYHRKILCGNAKCKTEFGFWVFTVSERKEKEYRQEIRKKQEERLKKKEQLADRSKRAKARGTDAEIGAKGKDKLFLLNLLDDCPKCGEEVDSSYDDRKEHLMNCNDQRKMDAYAKQLKQREAAEEKKKKLQEAQEEAQNASSWDFLGGKTSDLWLLSEKQLKIMCESYQINTSKASKDELIAAIVRHKNAVDSKRMLTQGGETGELAPGSSKRQKCQKTLRPEDLPSNMETMSVAQLKSVAASFGIVTTKTTKDGIISQIEQECFGKDEPILRLTDGKAKRKTNTKKKLK